MRQFSGRTAAVTGAGSGIGRSLAVQLAKRACIVALADKDPDSLAETQKMVHDIGGTCSLHTLDVCDREAVEKFAADVVSQHGAVHMLFNNAGVALVDTIVEQSYNDFNWIMNVNFWGVVYGTNAFLPYMMDAEEAHIINISSLFGLLSMPLQSAYNASKFAVRGFTESLNMELAGSSIRTSCVHPGGIKTDIAKHSRINSNVIPIPKEKLSTEFSRLARTTADQAAAQIIRGIEKKRRRILVGWDAKLMDLVVRLFPGSYSKLLGIERAVRKNAKQRTEFSISRKS